MSFMHSPLWILPSKLYMAYNRIKNSSDTAHADFLFAYLNLRPFTLAMDMADSRRIERDVRDTSVNNPPRWWTNRSLV